MLNHVHPVRPDIAHRSQRTIGLRIDAPIPIGVIQQPILRVGSLRNQDFAQIAGLDHAADLLDHGIVAEVVLDAIGNAFLGRQVHQLARLAGSQSERLLAQHVLAGRERRFAHGVMQRVRRQNVYRLDFGILQQRRIIPSGPIDADAFTKLPGFLVARGGDGRDLHIAEPADILSVDLTHESGADNGGLQFFHKANFPFCRYLA